MKVKTKNSKTYVIELNHTDLSELNSLLQNSLDSDNETEKSKVIRGKLWDISKKELDRVNFPRKSWIFRILITHAELDFLKDLNKHIGQFGSKSKVLQCISRIGKQGKYPK